MWCWVSVPFFLWPLLHKETVAVMFTQFVGYLLAISNNSVSPFVSCTWWWHGISLTWWRKFLFSVKCNNVNLLKDRLLYRKCFYVDKNQFLLLETFLPCFNTYTFCRCFVDAITLAMYFSYISGSIINVTGNKCYSSNIKLCNVKWTKRTRTDCRDT
jgi:hypothetical protein